ncbi:acylphosphatase [Salipaludibacillus neizhouensis]|uniref:acylphosphatase n=1 Tax=Salipaludibacillus neizhouensis TaxID=885475 RepID=A0A3A9K7Z6_9BACI|nr:acylphosphatase [Salipaludibacillus neizhouensis]RKL69114.1 acylphosphatase [Salipaludibacillus neizhouensis]
MERCHLIVYGKVQGVGFRRYTRRKAILYQIKGWICNKDNGTVEIVAQGSPVKMRSFIRAVKKGSKKSEVNRIKLFKSDDINSYRKFIVRY